MLYSRVKCFEQLKYFFSLLKKNDNVVLFSAFFYFRYRVFFCELSVTAAARNCHRSTLDQLRPDAEHRRLDVTRAQDAKRSILAPPVARGINSQQAATKHVDSNLKIYSKACLQGLSVGCCLRYTKITNRV